MTAAHAHTMIVVLTVTAAKSFTLDKIVQHHPPLYGQHPQTPHQAVCSPQPLRYTVESSYTCTAYIGRKTVCNSLAVIQSHPNNQLC